MYIRIHQRSNIIINRFCYFDLSRSFPRQRNNSAFLDFSMNAAETAEADPPRHL
ncbi:hypothetical protein PUN28_010073 [Cardiocondyla obscurior]|uniref:Uncharacterized protein n=1 Tax=Cardiocondyla obscurior TaxID=286306 RepID=A0AAW2FP78_9HYME